MLPAEMKIIPKGRLFVFVAGQKCCTSIEPYILVNAYVRMYVCVYIYPAARTEQIM